MVLTLTDPPDHAVAVTPSNTVNLTYPARALYIGTSGTLKVLTVGGDTVTFGVVAAGVLPLQVARVFATGTDATNIVAMW